ncbi:PREDICTED: putative pyridoxal-dependent decarboxylase domain-containing protein 2 [Priapulus caudatus]|uniref:Pyridoxal-dependent decarboxylase domain-containing protein 1 n=1 Tax=Priapulus caudatus TaxID=37621 RepID=A0ABM1EGX7_PRICU|nr:PREDICTED: putative pyridoxal-dependent decarboxylase domain-containing protein 2 [Priapulus caudatus]
MNENRNLSSVSSAGTIEDEILLKKQIIGNHISNTTAPDDAFYKFAHPVLNEMQAAVEKNVKALENLQEHVKPEVDEWHKKEARSHIISGPLPGSGQAVVEVIEKLEQIILYDEDEDEDDSSRQRETPLQVLDEDGKMAVLSHSVAAYMSTLDHGHLRRLTTRIVSDTTIWLAKFFRFFGSSAFFHEDYREGLLRVCRLVLHRRYPKYASEGFEALYRRPPVLYLSAAARGGMAQFLCAQLGLPSSCVSTVPCGVETWNRYKMDKVKLEKLIRDDIAAGRLPVLAVANAGTPVVGQVDDIEGVQDLCKTHDIWLHVEGHGLASLVLTDTPNNPAASKMADSMTLTPGTWLGVPALPYVSLYAASEPALVHAAGLAAFNSHLRLSCLPLWLCLQKLGSEGVCGRVGHACELSVVLHEELGKCPAVKLISKDMSRDGQRSKPELSPGSKSPLINCSVSALVMFERVPPACVFRYTGDPEASGVEVAPYAENAEERNSCNNSSYIDALNNWLGQTMQRDMQEVLIDLIDLESDGVCIRFCPLENAHVVGTTMQDVEDFIACLTDKIAILNATVHQRLLFRNIVKSNGNLRLVDIGNWAGLGAVQFVEQMAEVVKKGIEAVNKDLEQENAEKIMQEGVLRYVPLVGSLVNWWSPPPKEVGIRGRTFDLTSGMIESTENTYKYHMQIQHGPAPIQKLQILAQPHGNDGSSQQTTGSEKSSSSPDHASKTPTTTTSSDDSGDGSSEASRESLRRELTSGGGEAERSQYDRQGRYAMKRPPAVPAVPEDEESAEETAAPPAP